MKNTPSYTTLFFVGMTSLVPAMAQDYPNRPIRLVVGFSPGGNADVSARLVAARISRTFTFCNALIVRPDFPAKTALDLVAMAKRQPGELDYGTQGIGSAGHLSGQMLQRVAAIKLAHVPYKGSSQALTDMVGGSVQVMFDNFLFQLPQITQKNVRHG